MRIGIILGSTRPGRVGEGVAEWVYTLASQRKDAEFEYLDIATFNLPLLDEPLPPFQGRYSKEHTKRWAERIRPLDGFIFVTAEYNHGIPAALKNAIDFLYAEWNNKAAGFVGYGFAGGVRAVESLRLVMGELMIATVGEQVQLSLYNDFENFRTFTPSERRGRQLHSVIDQVISWAGALKTIRESEPVRS